MRKTSVAQRKYFPTTQPLPGVRSLLTTLASTRPPHTVHVALATSSNSANFALKTAHLEADIFGVFAPRHRVLGDDVRVPAGSGKPAPHIYLVALETINARIREENAAKRGEAAGEQEAEIKPEECLVFEDSVPGVEAGRRAGMQVVWCPHPGLLEEYKGKEDHVLAGTSIMNMYGRSSGGDDAPGKVGDGWARLHKTLEDFPYQDYGIKV